MSKKSSSFLRHLNRNRKAPRSTLRVEPLESRQLWAVVEGAGKEVVSNVTNSDGVTYDQVLMTGSSVTVTNDAGQVTRVSYLDNDGDIVQVALVGPGKLNVSLSDAVTNVAPGNYNAAAQAYHYVQGDATITVSGPIDESSSLEVYSVGSARNPGVVDATHQGGDHWADISRVIIVGNEQNEAGYTNFGSIRTGNAFFSASSGVVGIRAENIAVQGVVRIGDIDATESGVPTLYFNSNSQFQNVFVQGGDLKQSNGASFDSFGNGNAGAPGGSPGVGAVSLGGFSFFNSINGGDSQGNLLWSQPVNQDAIRLAAVDQQTLMSGEWVFTLDASGKVASALQNGVDVTTGLIGTQTDAQASLDAAFDRRTFTGDITIVGDLKQNLEINIADARGDVTFNDDLFGRFIVDGYGAGVDGTLTVMGNLDGTVLVRGADRVTSGGDGQVNKINAIVVEGNTGPFSDVRAEEIGNIIIRHNFSGVISTNVRSDNALSVPGVSTIEWHGTARTGTGYVDVDGKIGNVTVGKAVDGTSNGGSIVNGTIQGLSGIGNVWVGGDVWGSAPGGQGVFVTSSNATASGSPTDVRNYGSANIGSITVHGDVDLDQSTDRFIHIAGNGTFGNILVEGQVTKTEEITYKPGPDIPDPTVPYTDARWISVFAPGDLSGSKVWTNQDSNGSGPNGNDYVVGETTAALVKLDGVEYTVAGRPSDVGQDLPAGGTLAIFRVTAAHPEGEILTGVKTEAGDKLIPLAGGVPIKDVLGNYVFQQNNIAAKAHMIPGPQVPDVIKTVIYSGNRGNLDGVYNNFGRIEIEGLLGAQQTTTGSISWTDSVDMDFGGITVNSSGNANDQVIGSLGTIGQITITNNGLGVASLHTSTGAGDLNVGKLQYEYTSFAANGDLVVSNLHGHRADLELSGTIGAKFVGTTNASTAFAGLEGLKVADFEDVNFDAKDIDGNRINSIIATKINTGIDIKTIGGLGNGTGVGTISPSVIFNSMITLSDGTAESAQTALLKVDVGMVNSKIQFAANNSGVVVTDGSGKTGQLSAIGAISLAADYVDFQGTLKAGTIGNLSLTGGTGILSEDDIAVNFAPTIEANTVGTQTFVSNSGKLVINETVTPLANTNAPKFATMGDITATSAYGDIAFSGNYQANLSKITLSTKDVVDRDDSGLATDKIGNITIDGVIGAPTAGKDTANDKANDGMPGGNVGDITATTTFGNITNEGLTVRGNAGALSLTTGVGVTKSTGLINFTETIWGTRGVATLDTATNAAGAITANFNYAGAFVGDLAVDALVVKSNKAATVTVNVGENDDNLNGVISKSEIGHGGNIAISTVKDGGAVSLNLKTTFTEGAIHNATLGNVLLTGVNKDVTVKFSGLTGGAVSGFDGGMGNLVATSSSNVNYGTPIAGGTPSVIKGSIGNVTLTGGAITIGDATDTLQIDGTRGKITAITGDGKNVSGGLNLNGKVDTANADALVLGLDVLSNGGNIALNLAGSGEYGNAKFVSTGGKIDITNSITGKIGDVELKTNAKFAAKDGALDELTQGGDITLIGNVNDKGTWGKITATTDAGTITHKGTWGSVGEISFTTGLYTDLDSNPNTGAADPGAIRGVGSIVLGDGMNALQVAGDHTNATYKVVNTGTITGSAIYSGAAAAGTLNKATTDKGVITLTVTVAKDQNSSGAAGDISLESLEAGNISLDLASHNAGGTINTVVYKKIETPLAPELTFGQITAKTGHTVDKVNASAADDLTDGTITITGSGIGAWANPLSATSTADVNYPGTTAAPAVVNNPGTTINRATVAGITATTTTDDIQVKGDFAKVGDIKLTTGMYTDASAAGGKSTITAGDIAVGTAAGAPLSIWGESGTVTLTTTDKGGDNAPIGASITGALLFGGEAMNADSLIATTERASIDLKVFASGFDVNKDGRVTDGQDKNIPGNQEFARVGNVRIETTDGGDIAFGAGLIAMDGTQVGPSIGNVSLTADDDKYTVNANAADVFNSPDVTFTGMTSLGGNPIVNGATTIADAPAAVIADGNIAIAGTIGDVTMKVASGTANLTGNFVNLGAVTISTGVYTDTSINAGNDDAVIGGNIKLGNGNSTTATPDLAAYVGSLNIAGTYKSSTLTVTESGTITGSVHVAGTPVAAGNDWTLSSARGEINVGFVAGFDADNVGGIQSDETGKIGNIVASSSTNADVFIGVGGKADASLVGNVTVSTGDVVNAMAGKNDFTGAGETSDSGDTKITGLSTTGKGTVGNLVANVKTGVAGLAGTFGNIGSVTFRTEAAIDLDSTTDASEEPVVSNAGDINLNTTQVWGSHGLVDLKTVDTSKLAAGKAAVARGADDLGNISGSIAFSGALALPAGNTDGIGFSAVSDRGVINVTVQSGIDEGGGAADYSGSEAGTVGNIKAESLDGGDITLDIPVTNIGSTIGTVTVTTGDTWQVWNRPAAGAVTAKYADDRLAQGDAKVLSTGGGYGTVGAIEVTTDTGVASVGTFGGAVADFGSVGAIKVTTDKYTDSTLDPITETVSSRVIEGGDISANIRIAGAYGNIALTTVDNDSSTGASLVGARGGIQAAVTVYGAPAAGSTIKALTQQGDITLDVNAAKVQLGDEILTSGRRDDNGKITDWLVGTVGAVDATSSYGSITTSLTTAAKQTEADNNSKTATIGDVTLKTGTSWTVNAGPSNDVAILTGGITITGASAGKLSGIKADTATGAITVSGSFDDTVGAIDLTSSEYKDSTLIADGDITFGGTFAANASTTVGTIDLTTKGAGTITINHVANVAWVDNGVGTNADGSTKAANTIDDGEQRTFSSGKLSADSVDGLITYGVDIQATVGGVVKQGYASKLDATSLTTSGTGAITILDSHIYVADITAFSAVTTGTGGITFTGAAGLASTWEATKITSLKLTAAKGDIATGADTTIGLNFADATNNKTTSASIALLEIAANDGNVTLDGDITAFDNGALPANAAVVWAPSAGDATVAATADNRAFTFTDLRFSAGNGTADATTTDGNVTVNGLIGGSEVTRIVSAAFTTPTPTDDEITLASNTAANISAHSMGTLTFNGNTVFTQTGGQNKTNVVADDSLTSRTVIGTRNYSVVGTELVQGRGAALNKIDSLVFNGAILGSTTNTLATSANQAEISASQIGSITIDAKVDPSYTYKTTVKDLDVLVTNGTGEFIAANSATAAAGAKYSRLTDYAVGNITITHKLQGAAPTTAVFGGTNVISAIGGMGNLRIDSTVNGNWQAPLFGATYTGAGVDTIVGTADDVYVADNGSAYFIVGDGDANINANTSTFSNVVLAGAAGVTNDIVATVSVGDVFVNVGSSTTNTSIPLPQVNNIGNAGGGTGQGFVLAAGVHGTGGFYGVTAGSVESSTNAAFFGRIGTVEVTNAGTRPDTNNIGAPVNSAAGSTIVVLSDADALTNEIADIINELDGGAVRPMNEADGYIIGDVAAADEDAITVFVL